jgi:uncharacterized protein with PIN domain
MMGFDTAFGNDLKDHEIVDRSIHEKRIILTRDRRLLFHRVVTHGFWVRSDDPDTQLKEVMRRLDLYGQVKPMLRCLECNGEIERVDREQVWARLEPLTRRYYSEFFRCRSCHRVYWEGSHVDHMKAAIRRMIET